MGMGHGEKRDVLLLCQYFYPEYVSSATLPWDTAVALAGSGLKVHALVGYPKEYYSGKEKVPQMETCNGVGIRRVNYFQFKRSSKVGRILNFASFMAGMFFQISSIRKYKCALVYSNPPVLPILTMIAKKIFKVKYVFVSYDVYPDIAVKTGTISEASLINRILDAIYENVYANADRIVAPSSDMKDYLAENKNIRRDKILVIPNWFEDKKYFPQHKEEGFIASYLGNMGTCQDMATILEAIEKTRDVKGLKYVFAGHGNKLQIVKKAAEQNGNITVHDYLEGESYLEALAKSDCFIISLEKEMLGVCSPSKAYGYMMQGRPILCIANKKMEIASVIEAHHAGYCIKNGDSDAFVAAVMELYVDEEKRRNMGEASRNLFLSKYRKEICLDQYKSMMNELVNANA